jgi:hypothetical protein
VVGDTVIEDDAVAVELMDGVVVGDKVGVADTVTVLVVVNDGVVVGEDDIVLVVDNVHDVEGVLVSELDRVAVLVGDAVNEQVGVFVGVIEHEWLGLKVMVVLGVGVDDGVSEEVGVCETDGVCVLEGVSDTEQVIDIVGVHVGLADGVSVNDLLKDCVTVSENVRVRVEL